MTKPKPKPKSNRARPASPAAKQPPRKPRRTFRDALATMDKALLAILVLSTLLRLWGIGDRLPDSTLGINILDDTAIEETDRTTILRSWQMWQGGIKDWDLNPHTGGWPAMSFYLTLGIQLGYKAWMGFAHPGTETAAFAQGIMRNPAPLFLAARVLNALIGVASVALTWRLALPLAGRAAAILAALFLAANPLHILTSQHVSDPNLLALVFVALAVMAIVKVAEGGGPRDSVWAGVWIGLAAACKYVPLVLVLPLAWAHVPGRRWKDLGVAVALVLAAMFIASPFTFLDWKTTAIAFGVQKRSLFSDWVGQSAFPISLPTYLIASLPKALGWPVYALSLAGFVALWRAGRGGRAVAIAAAVIVVANGLLRAAQERYMLVAYPMMMTAAGAGAWWVARAVMARAREAFQGRAAMAAAGLLAVVGVAAPAPDRWIVRDALRRPDSRHEARRWIVANVAQSRRLAVELYGPVFRETERNVVIWPFFATQAPLVAPAYYPAFLDGLEMIALSGEISRRFEADSLKYPNEAAYYRWLRAHGDVVWRSNGDGRRLSGPYIEVRSLPTGISTRAVRDSLFARLQPTPSGTYRLALWCHDMAVVFSRAGDVERAEEWARRGLSINAVNMNARLDATLAQALLTEGRFAEAEAAARAGLSAGSDAWSLHLYRGMALEQLGRLDEALAELRNGYARSGDIRVHLNIAQVLTTLGRYDEAVAELAEIPPDSPDRGPARRDMAVLLLNQLNRPQEGLEALREAAARETDPNQAVLMKEEVARLERMRARASGAASGAAPGGAR